MKAMTLDDAYEIIEKSSEGAGYPFAVVREAHRIIDESRKEQKPSPEGFFFCKPEFARIIHPINKRPQNNPVLYFRHTSKNIFSNPLHLSQIGVQ